MHSPEIIALAKEKSNRGMTHRAIANDLGLCRSTVQYMLKVNHLRIKKKRGKPRIINTRDATRIKRCCEYLWVSGEKVTSRKIVEHVDLKCSRRTAQRHLKRLGYQYKRCKPSIVLSRKHRQERVRICRSWLKDRINWKKVVFTDDKRWNLDGPDCWYSYVRLGKRVVRNKRQGGGGSIMFWGILLPDGRVMVRRILGIQNSTKYKELLSSFAVPNLRRNLKDKFVLQQDNCSVHVSASMWEYFDEAGIKTLEWPARSPGLNLIENV
jgi:transposase